MGAIACHWLLDHLIDSTACRSARARAGSAGHLDARLEVRASDCGKYHRRLSTASPSRRSLRHWRSAKLGFSQDYSGLENTHRTRAGDGHNAATRANLFRIMKGATIVKCSQLAGQCLSWHKRARALAKSARLRLFSNRKRSVGGAGRGGMRLMIGRA
jgi:hypothetical protein